MSILFKNREEAGKRLAELLVDYRDQGAVIYSLPRGGVVIGAEIAKAIHAPLDIIVSKKIGHPSNPEYAVCAIAEDGAPVCNQSELERLGHHWLEEEKRKAREEIQRRREEYLGNAEQREIKGKIAIIVDDGIATGLTMVASIEEMKLHEPKEIVVAIPIVPYFTSLKLEGMVDKVVCVEATRDFLGAVGAYYEDFTQVEDEEVKRLLRETNK